jgi:hypothetical protein
MEIMKQRLKKNVSFDRIAEVIYIPTKEEYFIFKDTLWYNTADYVQFKQEYINVLRRFGKQ